MCRLALLLVVAIAYVMADECPDGCPCGQECDNGACADGCMVYSTFVAAGGSATVHGRECQCGDDVDEQGRMLQCLTEGVFDETATGDAWTKNPQC